jgi:hypothetical protein
MLGAHERAMKNIEIISNRCSQRGAMLWIHREAAGCFMLQFPRG